ncbi:hypothetical protein N7486_005051, partial [Penicillium sp. IBT 16267x]
AAHDLLEPLRIYYPLLVLPLFTLASVINMMPKRGFSATVKFYFKWLSLSLLVTYITDLENWWGGQSMVIYIVYSLCNYTVILRHGYCLTTGYIICWIITIPIKIAIFGISLCFYTSLHRGPVVGDREGGAESIEVAISGFRILVLLTLALPYAVRFTLFRSKGNNSKDGNTSTESTPLLDSTNIESYYNTAADLKGNTVQYQS